MTDVRLGSGMRPASHFREEDGPRGGPSGERPRLVASDIDGTLVDDEMRVSPRTRAVVADVVADGADFVLCTGRPPRWIREVVDQLDHAPLAVCANGAVVFDAATGRVVSARTLEPETLGWLAEVVARRLPGASLGAECIDASDRSAAAMRFVTAPGYEHAWPNPNNVEVGEDELVSSPAVKLLVRLPGADSAQMRDALVPIIRDRAYVTFSTGSGLVEIAAPGVTKGGGLADLAARAGTPSDRVVAFGDMPNDVTMLSWAGRGVAVANAHPELRSAADEFTASNNDSGVARWLERHWSLRG